MFVAEYLIDYNGTRAAEAAGYRGDKRTLGVRASALLDHPVVKRIIGKVQRLDIEKLELDREEILKQLYYLATRKAGDFVDGNGEVLNINDMSERAQSVIDGIDQEVHVDAETGDRTIRTRLKISPKGPAVDMAMKHKGLFAPVKQTVKVGLDWDELYAGANGEIDEIEVKIAEQLGGPTQ
jgi:phage terminase small subunit